MSAAQTLDANATFTIVATPEAHAVEIDMSWTTEGCRIPATIYPERDFSGFSL